MKGHKIKVLRPKCFNWGSPRQDKLYFIPNYKKSINNLDSLKKKKVCVWGEQKENSKVERRNEEEVKDKYK